MSTLRPTCNTSTKLPSWKSTPSVKHCVSKIFKNAPQRRLEHHQAPGGWERLEQRQATWFSVQYCDLEPVHGRLLICFTMVLQDDEEFKRVATNKKIPKDAKHSDGHEVRCSVIQQQKLPDPSNDWATQLDEVWNEDGFVEHNQFGKQELHFVWARITRCWHGLTSKKHVQFHLNWARSTIFWGRKPWCSYVWHEGSHCWPQEASSDVPKRSGIKNLSEQDQIKFNDVDWKKKCRRPNRTLHFAPFLSTLLRNTPWTPSYFLLHFCPNFIFQLFWKFLEDSVRISTPWLTFSGRFCPTPNS